MSSSRTCCLFAEAGWSLPDEGLVPIEAFLQRLRVPAGRALIHKVIRAIADIGGSFAVDALPAARGRGRGWGP
jgi:hypothetical protein